MSQPRTNRLFAGTSSQLGLLGPNPSSLTCQICSMTGHSALQCPRFPSSAGPTPDSLVPSLAAMSLGDGPETTWYPDSGASAHMTPHDGNFVSKIPYTGNNRIVVGNGATLPITHLGTCTLPTSRKSLKVNSVLQVPQLTHNLVSIKRLCKDNNCHVIFDDVSISIQDKAKGTVLLRARSNRALYPLTFSSTSPTALFSYHLPAETWHRRLGHPSSRTLDFFILTSPLFRPPNPLKIVFRVVWANLLDYHLQRLNIVQIDFNS